MEILSIRVPNERKKMLDLCKNLWEKRALVPIVGSGFSAGTQTDNGGTIPTVEELRQKLFGYIKDYSNYAPSDIIELSKANLSDLARTFWDIEDRIPSNEKSTFYNYISENFQSVSFFKGYQKEFLKIAWPYLFTLNYDSLIENYGRQYYAVIPFDKINKFYARDKIRLFKLHGDAKKYLDTGDAKYFILSRDSYIQSMMDPSNEDMLNELLTAFASKSILFFGCGLSEELDLLYTSQLNLVERAIRIDVDRQAIIYISFETDESINSPLSQRKQDVLARYGITTVFRFSSETELMLFFKELAAYAEKVPKPEIEDYLNRYSGLSIESLKTNDIRCRDYLFEENLVWKSIEDHRVVLPGYYIDRRVISEAINSISSDEPLSFISGNFFSGKTISLIGLAKHFTTKKVYIFPSGTQLSDTHIDFLLKKENTLLCFDTKTLTTAQIKFVTRTVNLDELKNKRTMLVIAIDKSDAPMYKYIFEARNNNIEFTMASLNSKFAKNEQEKFNKKIGVISLPPYDSRDTLLDYVVNNEKELLGSGPSFGHFMEPQKELLLKIAEEGFKPL